MFSLATREATEVFFLPPEDEEEVSFQLRKTLKDQFLVQQVFQSDPKVPDEEIIAILNERLEEAVHLKKLEKERMREMRIGKRNLLEESKETDIPEPMPRDEAVNTKRAFIASAMRNMPGATIKDIARFTKSSVSTVKRVQQDIRIFGDVTNYSYNNVKTEQEMSSLDQSIDNIGKNFTTVTDLKRQHKTFSKKRILKALHDRGFKYRPLPRQRKVPKYDPPNSQNVCRVISHIAQALNNPQVEMLYTDEVKFPLFQTATHQWTHKNIPEENRPVYNRRMAEETKITVIAICSTSRMIAAQAFTREVTGNDFLFFLNKVLARLPATKKYTILADNAKWHHANVVAESVANKFLFFNEPRMFYLNIIEMSFSYIRASFRKRQYLHTIEQETREILRIVLDESSFDKFKGLFRHHLRQLIHFFNKHRQLK